MTSLVTGVAGFLGSHVADHLIQLDHDVVGLDDLSGGLRANVPSEVKFVRGSIANNDLVSHLFERYRPDFVYHLAAYAAEGLSPFIRSFNYQNNVVGSAVLISAAIEHGVRRFVFTSSIAVYGDGVCPFDESSPKEPIDPYGLAKSLVEDDLVLARRQFGLNYTIFRPHNVYGERQNIHDPYRNVVGIFIRQCLRGEPMTVFGDGDQVRAFSYVADVASIIAGCVSSTAAENQIVNIGSDELCSVKRLAKIVASAFNIQCELKHLPPRHEALVAHCRHNRMAELFGNRPATSLATGVARMVEWASGLQSMLPTPRPCPLEVQKGIPEGWSTAESAFDSAGPEAWNGSSLEHSLND